MQWTGLQKQGEGERALQVANSLGKDTPQTGINTASNAIGHTLTEYLRYAERYCEPEDGQGSSSREQTRLQVAHRLGSRGNHDREGDTCTKRGGGR